MTRDEVTAEIFSMPEFKKYPHAKIIRSRHKNKKLSEQFYSKLFRHFGYIKTIETWERQN